MAVVRILVNDTSYEVEVLHRGRNSVEFQLAGRSYRVEFEKDIPRHREAEPAHTKKGTAQDRTASGPGNPPRGTGGGQVLAPIPGVVVEILAAEGEQVAKGDVLVRLEAMKMQNNIFAPSAGTVLSVCVSPGEEVSDGQLLIELGK